MEIVFLDILLNCSVYIPLAGKAQTSSEFLAWHDREKPSGTTAKNMQSSNDIEEVKENEVENFDGKRQIN